MKLVFLSSKTRYLEHDLYCHLANTFSDDYELIYYESDFNCNIAHNSSDSVDRSEKESFFHNYLKLKPIENNKSKLSNPVSKVLRVVSNFKNMYRWKREFLSTIDKLLPSAVVMISLHEFNARLLLNERKNIKIIYIQPSIIRKTVRIDNSLSFKLNRILYNRILKLPLISNNLSAFEAYRNIKYLLWSEVWVSHVEGLTNGKFSYTGNPLYDKIFENPLERRLMPTRPRVLVMLNKDRKVGLEAWDVYAEFYRELAAVYSSYEFIFKTHPLGNIERAEAKFEGFKVTKKAVAYTDVDFVLTHWSTICLETIAKGVPTILINPDSKFDFAEFHLDKYPAIAHSLEEFGWFVENFANTRNSCFPEYRRKFIIDYLYCDDGRSTERILKAIEETILN